MKIAAVGGNLLKKAIALRVGKALLTKPVAMAGLGIGAVAGAGYLAYNFFERRKKDKEAEAVRNKNRQINNMDENNHDISDDKKIVI